MPAIRPETGATRIALRKKADGPSDPCPICHTRVARQSDLKRHMKKHDSFDNKTYRCPHCDYRSSLKCAFDSHLDKHDDIRYGCKVAGCKAEFTDKASLSRHNSKVHKTDNEKQRRRTSQLAEEVRKTRAPATVRREIVGNVNMAYSRFSTFASGSQSPSFAGSPSELSDLCELTDSDSESSPMPPTPTFSTSPQSDIAAYQFLNTQRYLSPEMLQELKIVSSSSELYSFKNELEREDISLPYHHIPAPQHPNYALTGFYGAFSKEPIITVDLQDISFDLPTELDNSYRASQALANCTPLIKDEFASSDIGLSNLAGIGLRSFFQHQNLTVGGLSQPQTPESALEAFGSSPCNSYQTTEYVDSIESFLAWSQSTDDSNLVYHNEPLQFEDFRSNDAPAPGYLF